MFLHHWLEKWVMPLWGLSRKTRVLSSPCWRLGQKTWNRRLMPAASAVNEIWDRPAACLPSGTSTQPAAAHPEGLSQGGRRRRRRPWPHSNQQEMNTHVSTCSMANCASWRPPTWTSGLTTPAKKKKKQLRLCLTPIKAAVNYRWCLLLCSRVMSNIGDWPDFRHVLGTLPPTITHKSM